MCRHTLLTIATLLIMIPVLGLISFVIWLNLQAEGPFSKYIACGLISCLAGLVLLFVVEIRKKKRHKTTKRMFTSLSFWFWTLFIAFAGYGCGYLRGLLKGMSDLHRFLDYVDDTLEKVGLKGKSRIE